MKFFLSIFLSLIFATTAFSQSDSVSVMRKQYTHADSMYLAKLNTNGNLMIAGGVGLCAVGGYLIYQGTKVYTTPAPANSTDPTADVNRNHKQGTIYMAVGGVAIAGGIIVTAFGAKNKIDFKRKKKLMEMQGGLLNNGNLGLALTF